MTEAEWLSSEDPARMRAWATCAGPSGSGHDDLERWRRRPSDRKLNLWRDAAAELCSCGWGKTQSPMCNRTPQQMAPATDIPDCNCTRVNRAALLREIVGNPWRHDELPGHFGIFANGWLTPTVISLAQAIHDDRAFDRMPMLGDALEEAGCTNAAILGHCRGEPCQRCRGSGTVHRPDPCSACGNHGTLLHVRGCWVLDLLLGLE